MSKAPVQPGRNNRDAIRTGLVLAAVGLYLLTFSIIPIHVWHRGSTEPFEVVVVAALAAIICFIWGFAIHKSTGRTPKCPIPRSIWLPCFLTNLIVTVVLLIPATHSDVIYKSGLIAAWAIASAVMFRCIYRNDNSRSDLQT